MSHHVLSVWRSTCPGRDEAVVHDHGAIAVYGAGGGTLFMGAAWQVRAGDVVLIPEGAPHYRKDTEDIEIVGIGVCMPCLPGDRWGAVLREAFDRVRRGASPVRRPDGAGVARIRCAVDALEVELGQEPHAPLAVDGWMSVFTAELVRADVVGQVAVAEPLVARALAFIDAHALDGIGLAEVAAAVGRAPTHLAAVVKQETGRTVGDWILDARMALARQLLLTGDDTVDVIAERVGFASPSHFHRTFRRVHDLPPARWRRLHRAGQRT